MNEIWQTDEGWCRTCPSCEKTLLHTGRCSFGNARSNHDRGMKCRSCGVKEGMNWTPERRAKFALDHTGTGNYWWGRKQSDTHIQRRLHSTLDRGKISRILSELNLTDLGITKVKGGYQRTCPKCGFKPIHIHLVNCIDATKKRQMCRKCWYL